MLNYDLSKSNSGRWKNEFNEEEQLYLNKQLKKYLIHYKYCKK
jgi:hypothetical protein